MNHVMTHEQWGDVITLVVLAATFWELFRTLIARTWKWERLGVALTVLVGVLAFAFSEQALSSILQANVLPLLGRYLVRLALIAAGIVTIIVVRFDDAPQPPIPPRRHHHRVVSRSERNKP
jgi:hypothetical protein